MPYRVVKNDSVIQLDGEVIKLLPNMTFVVRFKNNVEIQAFLCGKMKMKNIRVLVGDQVKVEVSSYDLTKGRIVIGIDSGYSS